MQNKIMVLNGPNLNLLGQREPEIYGTQTYETLVRMIKEEAHFMGIDAEVRQSNHEGVLVDWIQEAAGKFDGIIINPAAYTHTSIAIPDAIRSVKLPTVEVHISQPQQREDYRRISYTSPACIATIAGHGLKGYLEAMELLNKEFLS